jgi:hypothetical protein
MLISPLESSNLLEAFNAVSVVCGIVIRVLSPPGRYPRLNATSLKNNVKKIIKYQYEPFYVSKYHTCEVELIWRKS